jgi:hypothetical protein
LREVLLHLAGETHDEGRSQVQVADAPPQFFQQLFRRPPGDPPPHAL